MPLNLVGGPHLELQWVDSAVRAAVNRPLGHHLQRVHELVALDHLGTAQLQYGVADSARPVIHQLGG